MVQLCYIKVLLISVRGQIQLSPNCSPLNLVCQPLKLKLISADTFLTPDAGKTSASRQTFVSGNAAVACARELRSTITRRFNVASDAELQFGQSNLTIKEKGQGTKF